MGVEVVCLDSAGCPAALAGAGLVEGSFKDARGIRELASRSDVLTVEIEHVDCDALEAALAEAGPVAKGLECHPSPACLRVIQDKYAQKKWFAAAGVPLPPFQAVDGEDDLSTAISTLGLPLVVKSRRGAYDGRGNAVLREDTPEARATCVESLGGFPQGLYAEGWAPFVKELAVLVARDRSGAAASAWPLVETHHRDSICLATEAPAGVPDAVGAAATQVALKTVASLPPGAGVYAVELFLLPDGSVLVNEVAPRVHNSGHWTIEGSHVSQFEQHCRAVLGWPLGDAAAMASGSAVMYNVLGAENDSEGNNSAGTRTAHAALAAGLAEPGAGVHWYCKAGGVRRGRKVGHVTVASADRAAGRAALGRLDPEAAAAFAETDAAAEAAGLGIQPGASTSGSAAPCRPVVAVIMGSDSDLPTMRGACEVLEAAGVPIEVSVVSAHRTPDRMLEYAKTAASRGIRVIIAGAGGAAHLPGMVAASTALPVIGVPCVPKGYPLDGVDALLSMVSMPRGVPVATVAIGGAANAGLLACRIIGAGDLSSSWSATVRSDIERTQVETRKMVEAKAERLESRGWQNYTTE